MSITRIELKDFLVFKGEFSADFCPELNVIIGGNGTGKTTLIKAIYNSYCLFRGESLSSNAKAYLPYFLQVHTDILPEVYSDINGKSNIKEKKHDMFALHFDLSLNDYHMPNEENLRKIDISAIFMPEKDILEHAKGLLTFIEQKPSGFNQIYKDVLISAQDIPTIKQNQMQKKLCRMIATQIDGEIEWDKSDGSFYTLRTDGVRIPFANEASGYKKLGYLGLLVASAQLREGTVLFWDEPENSLNPELVPVLVDILLELSGNGVQIFIATHDYNIARYIGVRKDKSISVMYHNLCKMNTGQIECKSSSEYLEVPNNLLEKASKDLFEAVVYDVMEVQNNE